MSRRLGSLSSQRGLSLLLAAGLLLGCAGSAPPTRTSRAAPQADAEEDLATLLLLSDRRMFEPFSVRRLAEGSPAIRAELALALGRIGDARAVPALRLLLQDSEAAVRLRAAFALGFVGDSVAVPDLLAASGDREPEVGRRAVEALARLGVPLVQVTGALESLSRPAAEARMVPYLFRFGAEELLPVARQALESEDPEIRRWAAYALARRATAGGLEEIRALLTEDEPWLRGWGARGLGSVGGAADVPRLVATLDDPAPGPRIQALRALAELTLEGRAVPPEGSLPTLLALLTDPLPGVRAAALEASWAWLGHERLRVALVERFHEGSPRERELALLALARGEDAVALELIARASVAPERQLRQAAIEAASILGELDWVAVLAQDSEAAVRRALLEARLEAAGPDGGRERAREALADEDPGVRTSALEWLAEHPSLPTEELLMAMDGPGAERFVDVRLAGVRALAARAEGQTEERFRLIDLLLELARHREWLVRDEAAAALEHLGEGRPAVGAVETGWSISAYRQAAATTRRDRWVDLETRHGVLRLRITCREAPLTCSSFLHLVSQGFYDGLAFHRVVPDFVAQAGDPRGDGAGGPGFTLRDEYNLQSYQRGVVGMALAGPDTGGSQFFITLSPQPHLDGTYTVFGRVEGGDAVLDLLEQGDRILSMSEVDAEGL